MTKRKKQNKTKENKRAKEAYPVVISSIRLFVTSNNLWSHPKIKQNNKEKIQLLKIHLKDFSQQSSILVPATKQMLAAVFLSLLSRQLNDCMCFLIYCTFFDYVQDSFKRMTSKSDSWPSCLKAD